MTGTPESSAAPDMSPAAIARRLEELRALYRLAMSLKTATPEPAR